MSNELFAAALGVETPWYVKDVTFDAGKRLLTLQLQFRLKMRLLGSGLMRPSPAPGDDVRRLDALLREPCCYAADFLNGPADKLVIAGIFKHRLGSARTLFARQRIVAIMAKASMTSETWRFHPCQQRVSRYDQGQARFLPSGNCLRWPSGSLPRGLDPRWRGGSEDHASKAPSGLLSILNLSMASAALFKINAHCSKRWP